MSKGVNENWLVSGVDHGWIELYEQEALRFLESEFGPLSDVEKLCAVFTSLFLKAGHTALPLQKSPAEWASLMDIGDEFIRNLPDSPIQQVDLEESKIIGGSNEITPIVLEDGMLAFRKNRTREAHILQRVRSQIGLSPANDFISKSKKLLSDFFSNSNDHPDWQKVAVAMSLIKPFLIISGGPGTGKTTTVARILALHQQLHQNSLRIALAAPTGKAAGRMGEALQNELKNLGLSEQELEKYPKKAQTVHRLLSGTESRGLLPPVEKKVLQYDLIIIDEASMIDLNLMYRLLRHLTDSTKLILLGDKDQLASVEAGSVFADLCQKNENGFSSETINTLRELGLQGEFPLREQSVLDDSAVYLTKSYRFDEKSGIGTLAGLVKEGIAKADYLTEITEKFGDIEHKAFQFSADQIKSITDSLIHQVQLAATISNPEELISHWKKSAWLTVLRHGLTGSNRLNQLIEERIGTRRAVEMENEWYHGRPVIITQNDYNLGVFNGDLGVSVRDESGRLWVYIETGSQLKRIDPKRVPNVNPAFFLTVHKSQGSEFDRVNLLLPQKDTPILTRELIYTAVTRARKQFTLFGEMELLETGIRRKTERYTGLQQMMVRNG